MPDWTREQKSAIFDRGGTLLVSASAGSGKTAVLVQRALEFITGPDAIPADRLLVLTFSNAAAAELRSRLSGSLEKLIQTAGGDALLRRQQMLLQKASISTVSAFCMQLLRDNFSRLEIPPDFTVAEDSKVYELRQTVMAQVLEESYKDPDFCAFAALFGRSRSDWRATGALLDVYDHLRALPFFDRALDDLNALYAQEVPVAQSVWGAQLLLDARRRAQSGMEFCRAALRVIDAEPGLEGHRAPVEAERGHFAQLQALLAKEDWDGAREKLDDWQLPKAKAVRGFDEAKSRETALRGKAKDQYDYIHDKELICTAAEFDADRAALRPLVAAMTRALKRFDECFYAAKLEEKVLEFSDFEHLALQLLLDENGSRGPLADELSARYDTVMVDEYQDTNALQDLLYHLLAHPAADNLFFVGDVKQSIYSFRQAMPEIFLEKKDKFAAYDGQSYPASLILGENFRSSKNVIEGINYLFTQLMSREIGGLDYVARERLIPGAKAQDTGLPGVCLQVVDTSASPLTGEADTVADLIARLIAEKTPVRGADGALRPCTSGDICVLLRSPAKTAALYADALAARGIPAHTSLDEGVLTLPEVQPLLAALRVIDNPAQDVPLAALMVSPMCGFSGGELTALRAEGTGGDLFAAVAASTQPRVQAFYRRLLTLRSEAAFLPVDALCEKLLDETGYLLAVQAAGGGEDGAAARRGALLDFVRLAAGYAAAGSGGLSGFLRSVDSALERPDRSSGGAAGLPDGYVNILSIHRSKGLEFPICILADTGHGFNKKDLNTSPVLRHAALGIGMDLGDGEGTSYATVPKQAIRQALERELLSEEMRVLYVAMTRARDRLFLIAASTDPAKMLGNLALTITGAGGLTPQIVAGGSCFADWICAAALLHPQAEELRRAAGAADLPLAAVAPDTLTAQILPAAPHPEIAPGTAPAESAAPDPALLAELEAGFAWRYPHQALQGVPAKVSVSALVRAEHEQQGDAAAQPPTLKRPSFLYKEGLSAAERGTALHAVLELADFAAARRDLSAELTRLTAGNFISPESAAAADRAALAKFFASPLVSRMLAADCLRREYPFFFWLPAGQLPAEYAAGLDAEAAAAPVLVQGVADCVIEKDGALELIDYKTDRHKSADELRAAYAPQLALYRTALSRRLGLPVQKASLYSFALGCEVEVF